METVPDDAPAAEDVTPELAEPAAPEPVAPDTVLVWLARTKAAAVLAALREEDFIPAQQRAFLGFRINAQSFNTPLVRSRLAAEAGRDSKLAERLQQLADVDPPAPVVSALPVVLPPAEARPANTQEYRDKELAFRARRDHLRQERDEARYAQKQAEDVAARAEDARRRAEDAQTDAQRLAEIATARVNRLERQMARVKAEADGLRRAVRQSPAPSAQENGVSPAPLMETPVPEPPNPFAEAVRRLLERGRPEAALALTDDVLRADENNADALFIAAAAHEKRGDARAAALFARRLLSLSVSRGQMTSAADVLGRLLSLAPAKDAERDARAFLSALRPSDAEGVEAARTLLTRLAATLPRAHDLLREQMDAAPPALLHVLFPPPTGDGPDDPLPLEGQTPPSAREVVSAIDAANESVVLSVRERLHAIVDKDVRARVLSRIADAASGDPSYGVLLTARGRGPVVVDGSNVAWYGQELLAAPRARLRSLLEMRRALREKAYFPILIYADANLPYAIDDADSLRELLARGEIRRVDAGTQADIVVLREAKRLNAPVVTNDYMNDYDPNRDVPKIRFDLPPMGGAYLLT